MRKYAKTLLFLTGLWGIGQEAGAETLLELYRQAIVTNPVLRSQELAVDQAAARKDQVRSKLLPQLSANAVYSRNNLHTQGGVADDYGSKRRSIQARQALVDLSSYYQMEAEKARVRQNEEQVEALRMALAGDLVDRYVEALGAAEELAYVQAEMEAVASQRNRLNRMYERQMAKITDVYEVEAYYTTLTSRQIEVRNAKEIALERLREITGLPVADVQPLTRVDFPPVPRRAEEWVEEGVGNNRQLAALRHAIESEEKGVSGARAQHAPQLALVASKTWSDTDPDNRRSPPFDVATIGIQLVFPLLEGGRVDGAVRESIARRDIARQRYEEKRREVEREIRTAYLKSQADQARIEATSQSALAQEKARDAQQRGFELGTTTLVDMLDARRRLLRARADQSIARHDFVRSLTWLRIQSGVLSEADLEEMDRWFSHQPPEQGRGEG